MGIHLLNCFSGIPIVIKDIHPPSLQRNEHTMQRISVNKTVILILWDTGTNNLDLLLHWTINTFHLFLQIWQGAGWWNRNVPPGSSTDRYPAGSDVHLGFLGASCWSLLWRQWRQGLDDPYGWHPWPFWIGTKVFTTVHHRRTILSRPTLVCKCYGLWVWNVIFDFE